MNKLIDTWSSATTEEDSMTKEHAWIWRKMILQPDLGDLSDAKVLDVGCNQGGFLRMLYDLKPYRSAVGIDLAQQRVALAEAHKGNRPVTYIAGTQLHEAGCNFDVAFSHEVIYLIEDLADHARQISNVLKPGCSYYAVTCCHSDSPVWADWRARIMELSNLPVPNHSVADISSAFRCAGFDVAVSRFLADAYIPLGEPGPHLTSDVETLDIYSQWKLMFRFTSPQ